MSTCKTCGTTWDATRFPFCPNCQANQWAQTPDLVRSKHHPGSVAVPWDSYHTTVPEEFMLGSVSYLQYFARYGTWFRSVKHGYKPCVICYAPLGSARGTAWIPKSTIACGTQDCFMVVDLLKAPHVHVQDSGTFQQQLNAGSYIPLPICAVRGCSRLAIPGKNICVHHDTPPLAD